MEAVRPYTRQVLPSLKPVNVNYFLSVKNMLEEGSSERDHITLNTTIYCVKKQQIVKRKFIHEPATIVTYIIIVHTEKKSTQPTANIRSWVKTIIFALKHRLTVK